jgi:hypothetical protein
MQLGFWGFGSIKIVLGRRADSQSCVLERGNIVGMAVALMAATSRNCSRLVEA